MSEFVSRKFKATRGDWDITAEKIYETFVNEGEEECFLDDAGDPRKLEDHIDENSLMQLITEPETKTLQIEEGKFYTTRDGRKVGPMVLHESKDWASSPGFEEQWYTQHNKDFADKVGMASIFNESASNLISEYKEPEIKVGDLYTFVGEEGNGYYTKGSTYEITGVFPEDQFTMSDDVGTEQHWWPLDNIKEIFVPGRVDVKTKSPIKTKTVKQIISGDYGRLHVDSDGYHSLNLSIIDGKSRCVSVDEMREMIDVLTLIVEAKEGK